MVGSDLAQASGQCYLFGIISQYYQVDKFCSWQLQHNIKNSVVTIFFSLKTSSYRICLSSGRGWTVMPWAPKRSQSLATCIRSGLLPPRELRRVAILLMLTDSLVIFILDFFAIVYFYGAQKALPFRMFDFQFCFDFRFRCSIRINLNLLKI